MRHALIAILVTVILLTVSGCGEAFVSGFASGAATMKVVADQTNKTFVQAKQEADQSITILEMITQTVDPNTLILISELIQQDPNQIKQVVFDLIETHEDMYGAAATVKQEADNPRWWIALALGLTAAYQKYKRTKA